MGTTGNTAYREPWNKGKIVGQKAPLKLKDIWALRVRLQTESRVPEPALFNLAIDSKLRGCDLVALRVWDVCLDTKLGPFATAQLSITPSSEAEVIGRWRSSGGPSDLVNAFKAPNPKGEYGVGTFIIWDRALGVTPLRAEYSVYTTGVCWRDPRSRRCGYSFTEDGRGRKGALTVTPRPR